MWGILSPIILSKKFPAEWESQMQILTYLRYVSCSSHLCFCACTILKQKIPLRQSIALTVSLHLSLVTSAYMKGYMAHLLDYCRLCIFGFLLCRPSTSWTHKTWAPHSRFDCFLGYGIEHKGYRCYDFLSTLCPTFIFLTLHHSLVIHFLHYSVPLNQILTSSLSNHKLNLPLLNQFIQLHLCPMILHHMRYPRAHHLQLYVALLKEVSFHLIFGICIAFMH